MKIRVSISNPRSTRSSLPEKLSSKHQVEAISLVKEEAADREGDEDKAWEGIYQAKKISIWNVFPIYVVYYAW